MDEEHLKNIVETNAEILKTLRNLVENPLLVTQEELDAFEFNVGLINSFSEDMLKMYGRRNDKKI